MVNKPNLLTELEYGWRRHLEEIVLSIWILKVTYAPLVMADKRKLQCEIDRTLKKIVEGIEVFDDMWEKVHTATNCNMKEKQEAELKKEIKKLQRLRDFVKNWLASNEIKDKNSLLEHKKLIELKMEQFKVIERETKTKAYSTVGLGSAAKIDPKEKEKDDIRNWLSSQIDALNFQVDQIESEVESITSKKKKLEKEKLELENYKHELEQHRFHIGRLELTMRLVDNDALDLQLINKIKDNVEYYVSLGINRPISTDDSMIYLYDELNLDEESEALGSKLSSKLLCDGDERISETSDPGRDSLPSPISSPTFHSLKSVSEDDEKPKLMSLLSLDSKQINGPSHHHHHHHHSSLKGSTSLSSHHHYNAKHFNEVVSSSGDGSKTSTEEGRRNSSVFIANTNSETSSTTSVKSILPLLAQNYAKVASSHVINKVNLPPDTRSTSSPSTITITSPSFTVTNMPELTTIATTSVTSSITSVPMPSSSPHLSLKQLSLSAAMRSSQSDGSGFFDGKVQDSSQASSCVFPLTNDISATPDLSSLTLGSHPSQTSRYITSTSLHFLGPPQTSPTSATKTIQFHPLLGVAPLGQQPLDKMQKIQLLMVETALHRLPLPADSEKLRPGLQRNPGNLPPYYTPFNPPVYDSVEFFNQLQIETLFFIFYYMEGTKAQYLAAKALKLKSWRFHTKLLMWFQRFEEPKIITEEFEQGSYLFFDFETWAQRQQDEFMFEYRYLEDHDFN